MKAKDLYDYPSMGCQVPYNKCELCKNINIEKCFCTNKKSINYIENFQFICISIVENPPDPKCKIYKIMDGYAK